jgi:hypothetical protein
MKHILSKSAFIELMEKMPSNPYSSEDLDLIWGYLTHTKRDNSALQCEVIECSLPEVLSADDCLAIEEALTENEKYEIIIRALDDDTMLLGLTDKNTIVYKDY